MLKGTTKSGFRYEVKETVGDDFKLLKLLAKAETDGTVIPEIAERLLGEKQLSILEKILEKRDGYVSSEKISKEIMEIFISIPKLKN